MYNAPKNYQPAPKSFLKTITLLHTAFFAGPFMFGVVVFIKSKSKVTIINLHDPFFYGVVAAAVVAIVGGAFVFKQMLSAIKPDELLVEKLKKYQSAFITRCALLEGCALLGIVGCFLTRNLPDLVIAGLVLLYHLVLRPRKDSIAEELNLSYEEKTVMD